MVLSKPTSHLPFHTPTHTHTHTHTHTQLKGVSDIQNEEGLRWLSRSLMGVFAGTKIDPCTGAVKAGLQVAFLT